jgi:hypothetical protein
VSVCAQPFQPGVDPATFATDYSAFLGQISKAQSGDPTVPAEPALACYVFAACKLPPVHPGHQHKRNHKRTHKHHRNPHHRRGS